MTLNIIFYIIIIVILIAICIYLFVIVKFRFDEIEHRITQIYLQQTHPKKTITSEDVRQFMDKGFIKTTQEDIEEIKDD